MCYIAYHQKGEWRKGQERKGKGTNWGCTELSVSRNVHLLWLWVKMGFVTVVLCKGTSWAQGEATGFGHFHRAAHKTRVGALGGRCAHEYLKNRKKSNAYFGKSLVRLACNQEKNKEKSEKWKQKEINNKKKQLKVPTEELNSHRQMAHIITWHVAAAAERKGVHAVLWRQKIIKMKGKNMWFQSSRDRWRQNEKVKDGGVTWCISNIFESLNKCWVYCKKTIGPHAPSVK